MSFASIYDRRGWDYYSDSGTSGFRFTVEETKGGRRVSRTAGEGDGSGPAEGLLSSRVVRINNGLCRLGQP